MVERSTASGNATSLASLLIAIITVTTCTTSFAGSEVTQSDTSVVGKTPEIRVFAGDNYDFRPAVKNPTGVPRAFSINKKPRWAHFNTRTGRLYGTPMSSDAGWTRHIVIAVNEGTRRRTIRTFSLRVFRGKAPLISGVPRTSVTQGARYSFRPVASDPDQQSLTFAIVNKPTWATFDKRSGRLHGIPGTRSAGAYPGVRISVTDGANTASLAAFTIDVMASQNAAPTVGGTPAKTVLVGQSYDFQPVAADANGDKLSFSVVNLPSWTSFSSTTGRIMGRPPAGSEGAYTDIILSVSDGKDVTFLPMFAINVTATPAPVPTPAPAPEPTPAPAPDPVSPPEPPPANRPPTISGIPVASVTVGQPYSFQPAATDPDGEALTFKIANRPAWATFSSSTGRLIGTPSAADAGTYDNVLISVFDGQASAQLPAFSITASQVSAGSATLSWQPPTQNSDGSQLTNLAGYWIRYGTASNALSNAVRISNSGVTSAVIEGLSPATWYFAVAAYNSAGVESDPSSLAQKTVR